MTGLGKWTDNRQPLIKHKDAFKKKNNGKNARETNSRGKKSKERKRQTGNIAKRGKPKVIKATSPNGGL